MNSLQNIIFGSASVLCGLTTKIINFLKFDKSDSINELLFYGIGKEETKKQVGLNNLFCVYYVLIHASHTIDVCMPSLDSSTITKCLINVHKKSQINIRIVVHNTYDLNNLENLTNNGIEVRVRNAGVYLEHEFILIDAEDDKEAVGILGSLDFEVNRVNCNKNSTMLTSEVVVVTALKREFDRIWNSKETVDFKKFNENCKCNTQES